MDSQTRIKNDKLKILVTGSLGFLGKHLVAELKNDENFELLCLTRENEDTSYLRNLGINYQTCDLLDKISIEPHIQKSDLIIHLAAKLRSKNDENPYVSKNLSILKYSVPEFVKSNINLMKLIKNIKEADIEDGGEGAFYIYLKNFKE